MNHIFALLSAIVFATCAAPHFVDARDHLSPHQRAILDSKSPAPEEYRFSFDLPAGPQFTEAEKDVQRARGREVMPMVMKAFESGAAEVLAYKQREKEARVAVVDELAAEGQRLKLGD